MTETPVDLHVPEHPVRFVTAASLFDGHDASINIMRRILQSQGVEVIHLGHNRSVDDIVTAVIQEDTNGVALSSYQGGHVEYFKYLIDRLREEGYGHVKIYGGGGGVIIPDEIAELHDYGVSRIFSPEDGQKLGLVGMINSMVAACDVNLGESGPPAIDELLSGSPRALARTITCIEAETASDAFLDELRSVAASKTVPVLGITGTGGSGKSSLTDEIVRRFRLDQEDKIRIGVIAIDPTRRRGGGALLGDRIRMNSLGGTQVFFRSIATRGASSEVPAAVADSIAAMKVAGFDLVIVETPGIGQADSGITPLADVSLYVMTPEFGAASQLEKIDMLDWADVVAINKFERRGAEDALRDVRRQVARNREAFTVPIEDLPVYGTIAARFNDDGVTALYQELLSQLTEKGLSVSAGQLTRVEIKFSSQPSVIVPASKVRYLAEIAGGVRSYHDTTAAQASRSRHHQQLVEVNEIVEADLSTDIDAASTAVLPETIGLLESYTAEAEKLRDPKFTRVSQSGTPVSRVSLPRFTDQGELVRWLRSENLPGHFPYTAGVFPLKREGEDPARMFAGEGGPAKTNTRFHMLAEGQPATRLSTAFDSVTLYGFDPADRPDIYGKVGNSGVSIATLDDMKVLYGGFDLLDPTTSVSMTINGPAPTILAMFLNTAIDQNIDKFEAEQGRAVTSDEAENIRAEVLRNARGTVQADILKEDQGQNTCIFSTEFSLGMMADIQEWFVEHEVRNFYSVSISGYHIAEAGANPISQLAFTLSNGFTYVESYLARGLDIDDFAPNLSFFFSNGMDPEYTVIGRVARRIWAIAMKERYGANARSQKLKYHVQTSGRSLHAQEMAFNDIRTSLQALCAIYDNCNSLHTNAYDEAVTTPTEESVRRALAIQMVINKEWGLAMNENPLQGSFIVEELTDLVEEAVLIEFERISDRGGVLGAMETGYQRGKIQDESMRYEHAKHDGSLPIVGVNTFRSPHEESTADAVPLARSTDAEKQDQLNRLASFHERHKDESAPMLATLQAAALAGDNLFAVLMDAVKVCSLGQITDALFEVGGKYRRNV